MIHALQVVTGEEEAVLRRLSGLKTKFYFPKAKRQIRRGGKWRLEEHAVMPGYLFAETEKLDADQYFRMKYMPGVIRILGEPTPLSEEESRWIRWLCREHPIELSSVYKDGDEVLIMSGPLKNLEGRIERINYRSRKAQITVKTFDVTHKITLGLDVLDHANPSQSA